MLYFSTYSKLGPVLQQDSLMTFFLCDYYESDFITLSSERNNYFFKYKSIHKNYEKENLS